MNGKEKSAFITRDSKRGVGSKRENKAPDGLSTESVHA